MQRFNSPTQETFSWTQERFQYRAELVGKTFSRNLEMKIASFTIVRQNSSPEEAAFFFYQQDSSLESQGITCKYFISKWIDLPAFNDSFSGKDGMTTDMLNLAIKRCHNHNNPSVTTFLRHKKENTQKKMPGSYPFTNI